ncbi:YbgC/FadM family acyl-CoA thioesterase [Planosporangium thailandense]|uniref:YbgC/FadM family acyl-CoA thioesterase n=1 Tax=Planosporangium thailandense TaxID=765197 RepID=UPI00197BE70B
MIHEHRVRYHETDAQGFLFNSRYLELADVAMTEFFRDLGWTYPQLNEIGVDPSVVAAQLTFQRPIRFDQVVQVHVQCTRVGRSSFTLETTYSTDEHVAARAEITYVNVTAASARSRPLPEAIAHLLGSVGSPHNEPGDPP